MINRTSVGKAAERCPKAGANEVIFHMVANSIHPARIVKLEMLSHTNTIRNYQMTEIEIWIEAAVNHLKIPIRKLPADEALLVQKEAMSRYVKINDPRVWWLNLTRPVDEYYDRAAVRLSQILPRNDGTCWLIPETGTTLLPVYEIAPHLIQMLIEDCPGFEYNIVAKDYSWLVIETDHDQYYVIRDSDNLPKIMQDSIQRDLP
jgi:hypothetical protein